MDRDEQKAPSPLETAGASSLSSVIQSLQPEASADASADEKATKCPGTSDKQEVQMGSECRIQTLYEGPPKCHCCKNWVEEYPDDLRMAIEEQEHTKQKALIVRMRKNHNEGKLLEMDSLVVQSESLKKTLSEVFEGYQGITASLKKLVFKSPFHPFYYRWALLEKVLKRQRLEDTQASNYTQLLHDVLHAELRDTMTEIEDLLSHRVITWPLLWALFEPGICIVSIQETSPDRFFIVNDCEYFHDNNRCKKFCISVKFVDWDGHRFGYQEANLVIDEYAGTRAIDALDAFPVSFHPSCEEAEANAIARGRRFEQLRGQHYVAYSGTLAFQVNRKAIKRQVDGRIVVDAASYFNNTSARVYPLAPLDQESIAPRMEIEDSSHSDHSDEESLLDRHRVMRRNSARSLPGLGRSGNRVLTAEKEAKPVSNPTDKQLLLCNTCVRGYSLKAKQWGEFEVDGISDIVWNDDAFPNLILPKSYKDLILAFVEGQAASKDNTFDDLIQGKGLGIIMLLVGNPGIGKTLTAEAVADKVRRPLYTLSAGELGQTADRVEGALEDVLELAEKWDAVLLFDECDVFLQERSMAHLDHNEIVAVFLRLLEYYRGMMFMTTNRAESIDRAFQSRIHLTLHYPDLQVEAKTQIWRHFLGQAAQGNSFTDEACARLAQLPLNGREIKNTVKTAMLLATQQKAGLGIEQIRTVLKATKEGGDIDI